MATGKRQIRPFQRPHSGLTTPQQEVPSNIYTNVLYCQKLDSQTYIFAADSIGLCSLLFTQLSLKVGPSESKTATMNLRNPSFTYYSHSRSF